MKLERVALIAAETVVAVVAIVVLVWLLQPARYRPDPGLANTLVTVTEDFRKVIVLMDGAESLDDAARARCIAAGWQLFWHKKTTLDALQPRLAGNPAGLRQLNEYLTGDSRLHDADKLAFLDLVDELEPAPALQGLRDNLQSIQLAYREEVTRIFSQFATRGAAARREKWESYVKALRERLSREKILLEVGDTGVGEPPAAMRGGAGGNEVWGTEFPAKSVALTFDDGPHPKYTEQVLALLRKYGLRACFFELGSALGTVEGGAATLSRNADVAKKVLEAGHTIANHSYSHPVLAKLSEEARNSEIDRTSLLLEKVSGRKTELFRAPYGARNRDILDRVNSEGLRSVMWSIDSLDWADPIPESIAMRVLHELDQKHKGIILFHDIHKQSVLALSPVVEELQRQEYAFLAYDGGKFVKTAAPVTTDRATPAAPETATAVAPAPAAPGKKNFYRQSWAIIIGVNEYANWPKLKYAVNDANGIEEALVNKFGFQKDHIRKLVNGDATRQRIMQVLGDEFTDSGRVNREDRVFFFFAGHGATRTLGDERQIGFIVPADADRENYYSTAISMTQLRDAADLIPAKHIYFVMDSCYSGLALSRGSGAYSKDRTYLEEVTRRASRQILTAGGADQQVADDGPNGHSVFTWSLLQGLDGKADLDGNGVITASELGAYVSPIVSSFSKQTPTVGNMVGSEGGEFLFELQPESLTSQSQQMDGKGIRLNEEMDTLEKQIAAKQAQLLKLQQSVQAESRRLAQLTNGDGAVAATGAAAVRPPRAYDLDREARQLYREKKYDEALKKSQAAVALKPKDPVLLNNLGFLFYTMGRDEESLRWLEKTAELDPKRKEAHLNLAELLQRMGRNSEAKLHYEEYLKLYPSSPKADEFRRIIQTL